MLDFIPSANIIAQYTVAAIFLTLTPGPDMTLFLGKSITNGKLGGLAAFCGASTGLVVHSTAVALGLSAVLAASPLAFLTIKALGAAYLLYLAWLAITSQSALSLPAGSGQNEPLKDIYLKGLLVNLLNPKVIVFFLTFLPQFIEPGERAATAKLFFLGIYFIVVSIPFSFGLIWSANYIAALLKENPRALRAFDYSFAGVLTFFAIRLALAHLG